ncbi:hypothetical protein [Salmonella enterica]|uniref:hypothetical protein n=1 Tax=Salmonella enterica TaxID=28901 RepID=UPI003F735CBC
MQNQPCSGTNTPVAFSRSFCGGFLLKTFSADHPENTGCILAERRAATAVADFSFYTQPLFHFSVTDHASPHFSVSYDFNIRYSASFICSFFFFSVSVSASLKPATISLFLISASRILCSWKSTANRVFYFFSRDISVRYSGNIFHLTPAGIKTL